MLCPTKVAGEAPARCLDAVLRAVPAPLPLPPCPAPTGADADPRDAIRSSYRRYLIRLVALVRNGTEEQKTNAAGILRRLTINQANVSAIAAAGGIPPLVALVRNGTEAQKENAASALGNLSNYKWARYDANSKEIVDAGGIPPLVALVRDGTTEKQKTYAASVLKNLTVLNDANKAAIVAAGGIPPLVALVSDGTDGQKKSAVLALMILAGDSNFPAANSNAIVAAGGIPPLVALVREGIETRSRGAIMVLNTLVVKNAASYAAIEAAGGILALVAVVRDGADPRSYDADLLLRELLRVSNGSLKMRLLYDLATDRVDCNYWDDVFPWFADILAIMQEYGIYYDFLVRKAPWLTSCPEVDAKTNSPQTLSRMLLNFKILGAAATARSNPSMLAAKTLFKVLTIEIDEAMTSHVWKNSRALLDKTLTLLKYASVMASEATALATTLAAQPYLLGAPFAVLQILRLRQWMRKEGEEVMDTPEFRAMEDTNSEYNDEALEADLKVLGLDEFQIQQAQRFERWLAIAGAIASTFNAAADGGDAEAKEVMELAEAFVTRLTAPPGTDGAPPLLFEIEALKYAVDKRALAEMLAEEQTIEDQEANEDAAKVEDQLFEPRGKRRRTAAQISASLADLFGHEQVARLQLRAEDLHPLLVARYGHS